MRIVAAFALLPLAGLLQTQPKLALQKLDPTVTISVPENFRRLTGEQAQARSLSEHTPLGVYVDPLGDADLVVNTSKAFFDPKDVQIMKDFYKSNIRTFYNKATFTKEAVENVSGKKGIVFEFTGEVTEKGKQPLRKYVQVHYGLRKRRVIVATFSCEAKNHQKWSKLATESLNTLKITEK